MTGLRNAWRAPLVALLLLAFTSSGSAQTAKENDLVYQVFVRSFRNGVPDSKGNGDLRGVADALDIHLNDGKPDSRHDLGVGILWLMPIFPADSYHGYNVRDYTKIHEDFGTIDDLKDLIAKAHDRKVRIILDVPFNHTSNNHAWFKKAVEGDAEMRKRYHFRSNDNPLTHGWHRVTHGGETLQYFGLFDSSMPDLDFRNDTVKQEVKKIASFWLDLGIDGFRLDAAKHVFADTFGDLPEPAILKNNDWWLEFSNHCYGVNPKAVLVGEVLGGDEAIRRHSYGLEALLDEPFLHDSRHQMGFPQPGFIARRKEALQRARDVNRLAAHSPDRDFALFQFNDSHDENPRLASKLEDMKRGGMQAEVDQAYRVGMYLLLTTGRYPVLYNGQEIMQRGYKWNGNGDGSGIFDETLREPFPWRKNGTGGEQATWFKPRFDKPDDGVSKEEQDAEGEMLHLVRGITNLRATHPSLAAGEIGDVLTDTQDWMVFERVRDGERYLVLINPTDAGKDYKFHDGWYPRYVDARLLFWSDGKLRKWVDESQADKHIEQDVFVPPYGLVVLQKK